MTGTTVMILAGGLGSRLVSVVADRPKVLADVAGRPFVTYLLDQVCDAGFRRVVLCTGHRGEMVRDAIGANYRNLSIEFSCEPGPLGTGGALRRALHLASGPTVLAMNGDSFLDTDLRAFLSWYLEHSVPGALLLRTMQDCRRYGAVSIDADGRVTRFQEKGQRTGPGLVNAGVYLFPVETLAEMPADGPFSLETDWFPRLVGRGLTGMPCTGDFIDIGTPESYAEAQAFFHIRSLRRDRVRRSPSSVSAGSPV